MSAKYSLLVFIIVGALLMINSFWLSRTNSQINSQINFQINFQAAPQIYKNCERTSA